MKIVKDKKFFLGFRPTFPLSPAGNTVKAKLQWKSVLYHQYEDRPSESWHGFLKINHVKQTTHLDQKLKTLGKEIFYVGKYI